MAAGQIIVPGAMPTRDRNGRATIGKLFFYENETQTPAPVYTSSALTTQLANPVVSNAAGRFPAIWADEDELFTVVWTYDDEETIQTYSGVSSADDAVLASVALAEAAADEAEDSADAAAADLAAIQAIEAAGSTAPAIAGKLDRDGGNISTFAATLRSNIGVVGTAALAASGGSALVGTIADGTGAGLRDLQDRLRDFVSDADYDTLENAAAAALLQGKPLGITQTNTRSTTWTVPAGLKVVGRGGSITTTNNVANAIRAGGDNIEIDGVRIIGPAGGTAPPSITSGNGVAIIGAKLCKVVNCVITGFGFNGILLRNSSGSLVTDNLIYDGFSFSEGCSDILSFSTSAGNDTIISNNRCFSNVDIGIYVNATGNDSNVVIMGNICVPTTNGTDLPIDANNNRRHGILMGYSGGIKQVVCVGNETRGTRRTGIYSNADSSGTETEGMVIANNIIEDCGLETQVGEESLAGGIYILGGGNGTIVEGNSITNFRGLVAADTGAIVVNGGTSLGGVAVRGNTINGSAADGIVLKGGCTNAVVSENIIRGVTRHEIYEQNPASGTTNTGGHDLRNNQIFRTVNADFASINVVFGVSVNTTRVIGNKLFGFDVADTDSIGIRMTNDAGNVTKRMIVKDNYISGYYRGLRTANTVSGRVFNQYVLTGNDFENCYAGFASVGTDAVVILEGSTFVNVTLPVESTAAYIGRRENLNIVLPSRAAAPTAGTWIVGDRAIGPGIVGQPKAWTVTTAGVAGAAVWTSEGNL